MYGGRVPVSFAHDPEHRGDSFFAHNSSGCVVKINVHTTYYTLNVEKYKEKQMRFCTVTLGCKVNQYETQSVAGVLISRGHTLAEPGAQCDVCIINTCAVTAESVRKSRQAVRRMKTLSPGAIIAVCGCMSQLDRSTALELGADLTGGAGDRQRFALEIERFFSERAQKTALSAQDGAKQASARTRETAHEYNSFPDAQHRDLPNRDRFIQYEDLPPGAASDRTRALLKIQDGCDNFCAYCVIPFARGRARSLPVARAAEYARQLEQRGFREIVVTGVEISSYGRDLSPALSLTGAVREISAAAPDARLRLGSLDPGVVDGSFCRALSGVPNLCAHFHLSLQSGCDDTIRRMGRKYSTGAVSEAISLLRRYFPDCGITADLITGFPGETEHEFEQTLGFIKSAAFSDMHIFPFSPRPGTRAWDMGDQIKKGVRKERAAAASAVALDMALEFRRGLVGKVFDVLFEHERAGRWFGHCGNYVEASVAGDIERNSIRPVIVTDGAGMIVQGELVVRGVKPPSP